jgi:hypothetical protein
VIKNDYEWVEFAKLFSIYLDGIISIDQLYQLFDDKFGYKLNESLREEIKVLFPSRDQSRRGNSNILKPWNDLENQKFDKVPGSSYCKIGPNF